jgi:hypothetical protein
MVSKLAAVADSSSPLTRIGTDACATLPSNGQGSSGDRGNFRACPDFCPAFLRFWPISLPFLAARPDVPPLRLAKVPAATGTLATGRSEQPC